MGWENHELLRHFGTSQMAGAYKVQRRVQRRPEKTPDGPRAVSPEPLPWSRQLSEPDIPNEEGGSCDGDLAEIRPTVHAHLFLRHAE